MTNCQVIPLGTTERKTWACPRCRRTSATPTRSPPVWTCTKPDAEPATEQELSRMTPVAVKDNRCSHLGRLHRSIPAGWLHCGCGSIRLTECLWHGDLTIERPVNTEATEWLAKNEPRLKRNCVACQERNKRRTPPPDMVVLTDHGMGDVVLNCWYPQARQNVPAKSVDVVRLFGARMTDEPGEDLGPSWRLEMLAREPRIDFRARWFGVTEIRRPSVHLDPEAVAWAKTLREPGHPLVVFVSQSLHNREREWPVEHWIELGENLSQWGASIIMDLGIPSPVLQAGPWRTFIRQPIPRLAAMLAEADLVVSIDTGPAHMAGTMDRPTLVLFGPMLENSYEHMGSAQTIRSSRPCGGCNYLTTWGTQCHRECAAMRDLTPEAVAARAVRMLTPTDIGVCTIADDRMAAERAITRPPLAAYCDRHGYRLHAVGTSMDFTRPISWSKILLLQRWLGEHDWLWWADADLLVTSPERRLEELTDGATGDLLIASDANGINCGSFLLRNCDWSRDFLQRVWDTAEDVNHTWWEQWALMQRLAGNADDRGHVQSVRKRSINAYPSDWRPGDFCLHTPGTPDRVRVLREAASAQ